VCVISPSEESWVIELPLLSSSRERLRDGFSARFRWLLDRSVGSRTSEADADRQRPRRPGKRHSLTPKKRSLCPVFGEIEAWANEWLDA
jgi:hypothetical protein